MFYNNVINQFSELCMKLVFFKSKTGPLQTNRALIQEKSRKIMKNNTLMKLTGPLWKKAILNNQDYYRFSAVINSNTFHWKKTHQETERSQELCLISIWPSYQTNYYIIQSIVCINWFNFLVLKFRMKFCILYVITALNMTTAEQYLYLQDVPSHQFKNFL